MQLKRKSLIRRLQDCICKNTQKAKANPHHKNVEGWLLKVSDAKKKIAELKTSPVVEPDCLPTRALRDAIYRNSEKIRMNPDHKRVSLWRSKVVSAKAKLDDILSVVNANNMTYKKEKIIKEKRTKKTRAELLERQRRYSLQKYYSSPKPRESMIQYTRRARRELLDSYVRSVIVKTSNMKSADVPQSLIDLTRKAIIIKRLLSSKQP
jgi:hypothetical protein